MSHSKTEPKLLVTGASGRLGQRVVHHLLQTLKVTPDRLAVTTRTTANLSHLAALGVEVRQCDFAADVETIAASFDGADRILLISSDSGAPGVRLGQHKRAVSAAQAVQASHVVYTSMPKPETSLVTFAQDHLATESALFESNIPGWSIIRNNWYFENPFFSSSRKLLNTAFGIRPLAMAGLRTSEETMLLSQLHVCWLGHQKLSAHTH